MASASVHTPSGEGRRGPSRRRLIGLAWFTAGRVWQSRPLAIVCFLFSLGLCLVTAQSMLLETTGPSHKTVSSTHSASPQHAGVMALGGMAGLLLSLGFSLAGFWCWPRVSQMPVSPQAQSLAAYDHVTGLPTIRLFTVLLDQALTRASGLGRSIGVLVVELSQFRPVSTSEAASSETLIARVQAARIKSALKSHDSVAYLGDWRFAVLIDVMRSADQIAACAHRIQHTMSLPLVVAGQEVLLSCRIGSAALGPGVVSGDTLLDQARMALAHATSDHPVQFSNAEAGEASGALPPPLSLESVRH